MGRADFSLRVPSSSQLLHGHPTLSPEHLGPEAAIYTCGLRFHAHLPLGPHNQMYLDTEHLPGWFWREHFLQGMALPHIPKASTTRNPNMPSVCSGLTTQAGPFMICGQATPPTVHTSNLLLFFHEYPSPTLLLPPIPHSHPPPRVICICSVGQCTVSNSLFQPDWALTEDRRYPEAVLVL